MAEQGAVPDINAPVTESSLSSSVQETDHSENEYVIINSDAFAGKLLKDLLNAVKIFREQVSKFEKQLEEQLSLSQTNKKDIAELQERFQKDHVEKFEEHCKVVDELARLSKENEALQKELKATNKKVKDLTDEVKKMQTATPVTETVENEAAAATSSEMELPPSIISDLVSRLDNLASQMVSKEETNRRRSIIETHNNELRTANNLPSKSDSFDESDSLQRTNSVSSSSISSSGIGSSIGHPTLGRGDCKLFNIGEDENIPAADESLPPGVKLRPKTASTPLRPRKSMTEKDHNILEVIWAMGDLANALKRLNEQ